MLLTVCKFAEDFELRIEMGVGFMMFEFFQEHSGTYFDLVTCLVKFSGK